MKDKELLLVEKALKFNLREQTERLKIMFDMMINKEKEDFYFDKNSYLNFIKGKIIEADDHIKAFKNLSKIEEHKKAIEKRSLFKVVNKNTK